MPVWWNSRLSSTETKAAMATPLPSRDDAVCGNFEYIPGRSTGMRPAARPTVVVMRLPV